MPCFDECDLWQFALKEFSVDAWSMSPVSGIASGVPILTENAQMETQLDDARANGQTLVFVDESAPQSLHEFVHPENACYVLGRTGFSPFVSFYRPQEGDLAVKIPTLANLGGLPHQAVSIILHDRLSKGDNAVALTLTDPDGDFGGG
jgi:hypothetical protein